MVPHKAAETAQSLHEDLNTLLHAEFLAQIEAADFGIVCQILRLARSKNSSFRHDVSPVRDPESLSDVVIRDEDSDAAITQIEYYILNVVNSFRIDAREGLVKQNILRFGRECARNFGAPAFAT